MDNFITALNNSIPIFLTIAIVLLLKNRKILKDSKEVIAPLIFKFVLPFFVFSILYKVSFSADDLGLLVLVVILNILMMILFYAVFRLFKIANYIIGAGIICVIAYSVGPIIYPFVSLNFSQEIFSKVVIIDITLFVMIMILAPIIAALFDTKAKINLKNVGKNIVTDLVLVTVFITLVLRIINIQVPESILKTADYIGAPFSLLATIYLALSLKKPDLSRVKLILSFVIARFVISIVGALFIIAVLNPSSDLTKALILTFYSPISSFPLIYTYKHNLDSELVAQLNIVSVIIIFLTYPILITVLI